MAKQIKAIKCPHCGSVNKTKFDNDIYHCENCNTDYFLDNDDININIHHKSSRTNRFAVTNLVKNSPLLIGMGIIAGIIFILIMINILVSKPEPARYATYSSSSSPTASKKTINAIQPTESVTSELTLINYSQNNKVYYPYLANNGHLYSFAIVYRSFDKKRTELNGLYYEVRDPLTGSLIKKAKLPITTQGHNWYFRRFDNGITYIVFDDAKVYAYDENSFNLVDVSVSLFKDYPEFMSGIATVNLTPWGYEDSFYLLTNNGQEYFFYPLLKKVYDYKHDYDALQRYAETLNHKRENVAQPYVRTAYLFEKLQGKNGHSTLIKVVYHTTNISAQHRFGFSAKNDADKPYQINLQYGEGPIVDDKILAKDRLFFSPTVVYSTDDVLIIRTKNNASPNAYYHLQSLDTNTGEVIWTVKGDQQLDFSSHLGSSDKLEQWSKYHLESRTLFIPYADGYLVQLDYGNYVSISKQGEVTKLVTYQPEKIFAKDIN